MSRRPLRPGIWLLGGLLLLLMACGERDRSALSELALVTGLGLDRGEASAWTLTVELAFKPQNDAAGESRVFSVSGADWAELTDRLELVLDKRPYWGSAVLLAASPAVFQTSAGAALLRELFWRQDCGELLLAVAEEDAAALFSGQYGESKYVSSGLEQSLRLLAREEGRRAVTVQDYMEQVQALGRELTLPVLGTAASEPTGEKAEVRIRPWRQRVGPMEDAWTND